MGWCPTSEGAEEGLREETRLKADGNSMLYDVVMMCDSPFLRSRRKSTGWRERLWQWRDGGGTGSSGMLLPYPRN